MKAIVDLYSSTYLTAIGLPSRPQSDGSEVLEEARERPKPASLLIRIKRQVVQCASGLWRSEFDAERYRMADWWLLL